VHDPPLVSCLPAPLFLSVAQSDPAVFLTLAQLIVPIEASHLISVHTPWTALLWVEGISNLSCLLLLPAVIACCYCLLLLPAVTAQVSCVRVRQPCHTVHTLLLPV
jgi:hypothetical protein